MCYFISKYWGFFRHISVVDFQFNYIIVTKHNLVSLKKFLKVCLITQDMVCFGECTMCI